MDPFKHLLVATDFSESAARAEDLAVALAAKVGAKLTVLFVHGIPTIPLPEAPPAPMDEIDHERAALHIKAAAMRTRHADVHPEFRMGYPDVEIVAAAEALGVDLIVLGTHGRRGFVRALLGSVADKVVRTSAIPVMTVAPARHSTTSA